MCLLITIILIIILTMILIITAIKEMILTYAILKKWNWII